MSLGKSKVYHSNKNLPKPTNHILNKSMIPLNKKESTLSLEKLINRQIEIEEKIDSISNKISKLEKKKQIISRSNKKTKYIWAYIYICIYMIILNRHHLHRNLPL